MKANNYISKNEHRLLLIVAFVTFVSVASSFVSFMIESYNNEVEIHQSDLKNEANYGGHLIADTFGDYYPIYRFYFIFLTFFIFLAVLKAKKFFVSVSLALIPFLIFISWFINTRSLISNIEVPSSMKGLDRILFGANYLDFIILFLVSILLFWQISILLRMLIKTLQKENALP